MTQPHALSPTHTTHHPPTLHTHINSRADVLITPSTIAMSTHTATNEAPKSEVPKSKTGKTENLTSWSELPTFRIWSHWKVDCANPAIFFSIVRTVLLLPFINPWMFTLHQHVRRVIDEGRGRTPSMSHCLNQYHEISANILIYKSFCGHALGNFGDARSCFIDCF
jgi:hypothetical protein